MGSGVALALPYQTTNDPITGAFLVDPRHHCPSLGNNSQFSCHSEPLTIIRARGTKMPRLKPQPTLTPAPPLDPKGTTKTPTPTQKFAPSEFIEFGSPEVKRIASALVPAHASYQVGLLEGYESWSGSTLIGKAASYGFHYSVSRKNLKAKMVAAGLQLDYRIIRGNRIKTLLVWK